MKVLTEATQTAPKFMIFGLAGCGKTTLASQLKNPLVLDVEGGASFLSVPRTEQITKLETFYQYLTEIYKGEKVYDYLVIDSADWLSRLIIEQVAEIDRLHLTNTLNKSNGGYGAGKQVEENHVRSQLLPMLVALTKKSYGICLIAHAEVKDLLDADGMTTERIAPKIDPVTMNAFVEWCDAVFYLKRDGEGGRKLVTDGNDSVLAKNRMNLTGEIDLATNNINDILQGKVQ